MKVSLNGGTPIAGWFIMEHLTKMDDPGVPPFQETSICGYYIIYLDVWLIFGWLDIGVIFQVNMWLRLVNCWLVFGENVAGVAEEHSTSAIVMGKMMMFRPKLDTRKTGCVVLVKTKIAENLLTR